MPIMRTFVKSALEEVEAGCVRRGGKMEFLLERKGPSCYACCTFDIRCIRNGLSYSMYKFGTHSRCSSKTLYHHFSDHILWRYHLLGKTWNYN